MTYSQSMTYADANPMAWFEARRAVEIGYLAVATSRFLTATLRGMSVVHPQPSISEHDEGRPTLSSRPPPAPAWAHCQGHSAIR
jgi:hypothetical protein